MARPGEVTNFVRFVAETEAELLQSKNGDVREKMHLARAFSIAAGGAAVIIGLIFTRVATALVPYTLGISLILLAPASVAFLAAYEAYRVVKCCNIIIDRANQSGALAGTFNGLADLTNIVVNNLPGWAQRVRQEVDQTVMLSFISHLRA